MELVLNRIAKKNGYTIGKLSINGKYFCDTLEDADRGLTSSMSVDDIKRIKIYGETAIPTGSYEIIMSYSPKFASRVWGKKYNGNVPLILNVKGFSGVRIHPFNTATESLGCIAPGRNLKKGMVLDSTIYYYKLLDDFIIPALKKKEKVILNIK